MKISTSFLSIRDNLKDKLELLDNSKTDYIHLDIMDGIFTSHKTWNYYDIKDLFENIKKPLDIHLMVNNAQEYIEDFSKLKPDYITIHFESENYLENISLIKKYGIKVGISIKPSTKVEQIKNILPLVDLVLVMSVEPGLGGQTFIDGIENKINELYNLKDKHHYVIEVDGGINDTTVTKCKNADILVVGSFIVNGNYNEQIDKILK